MSCLGGAFLAGMIARMSKDYRHCRAGLPDLVVWNTSNNSYKVKPQQVLVLWRVQNFLAVLNVKYINVWSSFSPLLDCGGEGAQWPTLPEATDLAGWAAQTGSWCGSVSRGRDWSQRGFSGVKAQEATGHEDCRATQLDQTEPAIRVVCLGLV